MKSVLKSVVMMIFVGNIANVFGYGGAEHKKVTNAVIQSLVLSGYKGFAAELTKKREELGNRSRIEIIVNGDSDIGGVTSPDKIGYNDPNFKRNLNDVLTTRS